MAKQKDWVLDKFIHYWRVRKVVKYIPKNSVVCDIGCGHEAQFLKRIAGSIKYGIGLDKEAQSYKDSKIKIKKFRVSNTIPLDSETVDITTMLAVLEHLENPQKVLDESFRILKNNGRLILTTPTPLAKPVLEFLAFKLNLIEKKQIKDHKNYFHPKAIKGMLVKAGFKENDIKSEYFELGLNTLTIAEK